MFALTLDQSPAQAAVVLIPAEETSLGN